MTKKRDKQSENEFDNAQIYLVQAIEQTPLAMVLLSVSDFSILFFNQAFKELYGITDETTMINNSFFDLIPSSKDKDTIENQCKIEELLLTCSLTGKKISNEERMIVRKDNKIRWILFCGVPIFNSGKEIVAVYLSMNDITEKKLIENRIIKDKERAEAGSRNLLINNNIINNELQKIKEKIEEGDRLKKAFLYNMSHEIRTPMNSIIGFSNMLNKPKLSDEKRKKFTSIIVNSSNQLLSIVSDLLTISLIETKQENLYTNNVRINSIIADLLSKLKTEASNQHISLYAKQQLSDEESEIHVDKIKLTYILKNLLTNALKFTHIGFIEFGYEIVETNHELALRFYVKDTGIGISEGQNKKIFEPFYQANKLTQNNYGGVGLGLSISKGYVELLGGEIWVQSEPGKGSTFYFTIPYRPANEIKIINTTEKQSGNATTILVE